MKQIFILLPLILIAVYILIISIRDVVVFNKNIIKDKKNSKTNNWFKFHNKPEALCYQYQIVIIIMGDYYLTINWKPTNYNFAESKRRKYFSFSFVNMRKVIKKVFAKGFFKSDFNELEKRLEKEEKKGYFLTNYDSSCEI